GLLAGLAGPAVLAVLRSLVHSALAVSRPSARVAELAAATGRAGWLRALVGVALAASVLIGIGVQDGLRAGPAPKEMPSKEMPAKAAAKKDPLTAAEEASQALAVRGRVLDPDGKPVNGARVWLQVQFGILPKSKTEPKVVATTDAEGRFAFTEDGKGRDRNWVSITRIVATADGFGLAWADAEAAQKRELDLKLVMDEPIVGRILTLEGKPVAGARVRVRDVAPPKDADLSNWLAELKARERPLDEITNTHFHYRHRLVETGYPVPGQPEAAVTDAEGWFRITGLGRERLAELRIEGPTIATAEKTVMTRAIPNLTVPEDPGDSRYGMRTYYGARFDFAAEPTQPFEGVVTDRETGKPVSDVTVRARLLWYELTTVTDNDGRYRLTGLPPGPQELIAQPTPDQPYYRMAASGGERASTKTASLNFPLTRGVWVSGKVVNARTGKPEAGVPVWYRPLAGEPAYESVPGSKAWSNDPTTHTAGDGTFRVVAFPCRGAIAVTGFSADFIGADHRPLQGDVSSLDKGMRGEDEIPTSPAFDLGSHHAAAIVNVDPKRPKEYTITLDPGLTVKAKLVDADGKPVEGVQIGAQSTWGLWSHESAGPEVEITQFNPDRPRAVLFLHPGRGIGKVVTPKKGDAGPWTVTLEPTATVTGRLVSEDGNPIANAVIRVHYLMPGRNVWTPSFVHELVRTDDKGVFKLTNLVAGLTYSLDHRADNGGGRRQMHYLHVKPKTGETKDLGDVKPVRN
ncbi:MAG: carboxypeptidase regulatory-like domain-containing protein, partial [Zavarzinella sp.]|nr:carboxypeptidase regulatory-like domain-containing protein [Zavarzinella sp.]